MLFTSIRLRIHLLIQSGVKHGRLPILFITLFLLFSLGRLPVLAEDKTEPALTLQATAPVGPFAIGDTIDLSLTLIPRAHATLPSVQLDLPYQEYLLYQSGPGFQDAAAKEGTVDLGDLSEAQTISLTTELIAAPAKGIIELTFQVRTASTEPVSATIILPVVTDSTSETVLSGAETALSVTEPTQWQFIYTPPGISSFTAATTYGYPIALPPGIGGLAPSLALSYSSRGADGMEFPAMASGFGVGWGMPQAEIVNGNAADMFDNDPSTFEICPNFSNSYFTLSLNGTSYQLRAYTTNTRHGLYTASGDPSLYIEYVNNNQGGEGTNVTGEHWLVRTPDGTTYVFGASEHAEQVVSPLRGNCYSSSNSNQPRNKNFMALKWKLESVTDVYGRQIRYIYGTGCGQHSNANPTCRRFPTDVGGFVPESYTFASPTPNQSGNQFRTEVDVALDHIEYNFVNNVAQTTVTFDYSVFNLEAVRDAGIMSTGRYRPDRLIIRQGGQVVSAYVFDYPLYEHYVSSLDLMRQYWWITSITPYGSDYNPTNGSGTALPAQNFYYEQSATGCGNDLEGNPNCVALLSRVANGYGGVTRIVYERYDDNGNANIYGKWFVAREIYTWDGVRSVYTGNNSTALSRLYYNRTGFTACFDKYQVGNGCFSQSPTPSDSLVGFNGVVINTEKPNGSGGWATVARQKEWYNITDYWLNGKTTESQQLDPGTSAILAKTVSNWQTGGNPAWQARLMQQDQYIYAETTLHTYQIYSYDASYGAVYEVRQYREDTNGDTLYRCTQNAYIHQNANPIWLINRPIRQTTYAGNCGSTRVSETLYRYDGSTAPSVTALNGKAALERTLTWVGQTTNDTRYVTNRVVYSNGLPQYTYTYNDYSDSSTNTYASNIRNTQHISAYNALGLPTAIQTSATGIPATQSQTMGYETLRPWLVTSITDANTDTTSYEYDKFGRLRKVIRPGDSSGSPTLEYRYSDDATVTGVGFTVPLFTEIRTKSNLQQPTRSFYSGLGQLLQTQQAHAEVGITAADKDIVVTYAYNERGLTTCQTYPYDVAPYTGTGNPFRLADNCLNYAHTDTTYDTLGRVYSVTVPDGSRSVYHYGTATVGTQIYTYQDVIDPNRHRTAQFSDAFGRLVQVAEFSGDCGNWTSEGFTCSGNYTIPWAYYATTTYAYNQRDQLTSVTDAAGNITSMTYDALGRKLTMNDPDMGNWSYGYDPAGNLVSQMDAKGQLIDFYYDGFNRMTSKAYDTSVLAMYTYDQNNNGISRLTRVDDLAGYHTFSYDNRGRMTSETQVINGSSYTMQYSYDALDRMTSMTYPNGEVVNTGYNNQGLPESLSGTNTYVTAATYNRMSQLKSITLGNNLTTWYGYHGYEAFGQNDTYDAKEVTWNWPTAGHNYGQLWRTCTAPTSNTICQAANRELAVDGQLLDLRYDYDDAGNVAGIRDKTNSNQVQTFAHDHRNRLLSAFTDAVGEGQYSHSPATYNSYTYDEIGNLMSYSGRDYIYNSTHKHAVATIMSSEFPIASFSYDANGNMTSRNDSGTVYTQNWDVENRLTSVTVSGQTTNFTYDANGQRMKAVLPDGTVLHYPFPGYEVENPGLSTETKRTTYNLGGQAIANRENGWLFGDNFNDGNANGWTAHNGTWSVSSGKYRQTNSSAGHYYSSTPLPQSGAVTYEWTVTFDSGSRRAGMYIYANTASSSGPDNAYQIWQRENDLGIWEVSNGGHTQRAYANLSASNGQTYNYKASYDPATGVLTVWRNNVLAVSWTFGTPRTSGNQLILRTTDSQARFDDIKVNGTTLTYLHNDHLGSNSLMSKNNGTMVLGSQTFYLPFGDYRGTAPNQTLTDRGYTGHKENMELGLIYMNARYYLPGLARFASADTIVPNPANPQNYNRYSYVLNSPLNYTDPTGHYEADCSTAGECGPVEENWFDNNLNYLSESDNPIAKFIIDDFNFIYNTLSDEEKADPSILIQILIDVTTSGKRKSQTLEGLNAEATWGVYKAGQRIFDAVVTGLLEGGSNLLDDMAYEIADNLPCSFSADTLVMTAEGLISISELEIGDHVLAYNEETREIAYYPVTATWIHIDPVVEYLTIDEEIIETTPNHPFYTAEGEWVYAGSLALGDEIRNATWNTGKVEAISFLAQPQFMYNLTVGTAHTYFVGEGQWLVHNQGCGPQIHWDSQGKHIPGHKNYISGRSTITHNDPQGLIDNFAGTGNALSGTPGQPGYKEWVNFGEEIGVYINPKTGDNIATATGIIHYSGRGVHIVPARPITP